MMLLMLTMRTLRFCSGLNADLPTHNILLLLGIGGLIDIDVVLDVHLLGGLLFDGRLLGLLSIPDEEHGRVGVPRDVIISNVRGWSLLDSVAVRWFISARRTERISMPASQLFREMGDAGDEKNIHAHIMNRRIQKLIPQLSKARPMVSRGSMMMARRGLDHISQQSLHLAELGTVVSVVAVVVDKCSKPAGHGFATSEASIAAAIDLARGRAAFRDGEAAVVGEEFVEETGDLGGWDVFCHGGWGLMDKKRGDSR